MKRIFVQPRQGARPAGQADPPLLTGAGRERSPRSHRWHRRDTGTEPANSLIWRHAARRAAHGGRAWTVGFADREGDCSHCPAVQSANVWTQNRDGQGRVSSALLPCPTDGVFGGRVVDDDQRCFAAVSSSRRVSATWVTPLRLGSATRDA